MIERIQLHPVRIPMGRPFAHAGKRRTRTESVLVAVEAGGVRGWGEGAPRPYVTDETVDTVLDALGRLEPDALSRLVDLTDFPSAMRDLAGLALPRPTHERPMPAASAALEIALFDLACRLHDRDGLSGLRCVPEAGALVSETPTPAPVSLVLDLARDPVETIGRLSAETVAAVRHVKLKATADVDGCVRVAAAVRDRFGAATGLSVDVNGDWDAALAVRASRLLGPLDVSWLEEPVAARDWTAMREIRQTTGMRVMLDESCSGRADLDTAAELGAADYVNARISKCGGIFATLRLIAAARDRGIGAQLGVHVGEVGPLPAAARLLTCAVGGLVTTEAGRPEEWFPEPLTEPPLRVDRGSYVVAPLHGRGIGIVPSDVLLDGLRKPESVGGL